MRRESLKLVLITVACRYRARKPSFVHRHSVDLALGQMKRFPGLDRVGIKQCAQRILVVAEMLLGVRASFAIYRLALPDIREDETITESGILCAIYTEVFHGLYSDAAILPKLPEKFW